MIPQKLKRWIYDRFLVTGLVSFKAITLVLLSLVLIIGLPEIAAQPIPLPASGERNLRDYLEQTQLLADDGATDDFFGVSVALSADGNTAIVGALYDDVDVNSDQGSAYVFSWNGSAWTQQTQLTANDGLPGDYFGLSVALSVDGNTAIVGASDDDVDVNINQGSAYVFTRSGTIWTQQTQLLADDGAASDYFGHSVALSADGNTALVGATQDDVGATDWQGSAYVFTRSGTIWTQQTQLTADDGAANDAFGYSAALSADGNTALVGANGDTVDTSVAQGSAYVFTRSGTIWTQQTQLTADDGAEGDTFGNSVAMSADGNTALVSAVFNIVGADVDQGSAYVFTRSGTIWTQQTQLTAVDGTVNDFFGISVSLSGDGNTALIGSSGDDIGATTDQGSAYSFTRSGTVWTEQPQLTAADGSDSDKFGFAVALSADADTALIGAWLDNVNANTEQGSAYIFNKDILCDEVVTIPVSQCNLLVDFYNSTGGGNWTNDSGWFEDADPCNWFGIDCVGGHVSNINLDNNNLVGTLPANIGDLVNLETLNLNFNSLSGTIPASLNTLNNSMFKIELAHNQLTGTLPLGFGGLIGLTVIDLSFNQLTGTLPAAWDDLSNLLELNVSNNKLNGTLSPQLGGLSSLNELGLSSNGFSGEFPVEFMALPLTDLTIDYNMLTSTNPTVITFLDGLNPTWDERQTIPPSNILAEDINPTGFRVSWTPILYQGDNGHYKIVCDAGTFTAETYTTNKAVSEVVISGMPVGTYTCTVSTFTPQHANNESDLTSAGNAAAPVSYGGQDVPPNDLFVNPIIFDDFPKQNYSLNIENATRDDDPLPPTNNSNCPVNIPTTGVGIHYEIPGNLETDGIVMNVGGPIWYSNRRDIEGVADTAIVIYEENDSGGVGAIVACDDDNAPGEVSVSNVNFDLDPSKTYRAVVWNEGPATQGAIIEIAAASFDLVSPPDDSAMLLPPTIFTWAHYANTVSYYFKVARTKPADELTKLTLVELTPDADTDNLICNTVLCTLTVEPNSDLADYLSDGNYLWSVGANMSANDSTLPLVNSNQIFRFLLGDIEPTNLLTNGNFETDNDFNKQPDGWTGKNLSQDKLKCNKPDKIVAFEGVCAFVFKGSSIEKASISQKLTNSGLIIGQQITLTAYVKGNGIVSGTKIFVNINYSNGISSKEKLNLTVGDIATYTAFSSTAIEINHPITSVKVTIKNRNPTGKLYVDDLQLIVSNQTGIPADVLLPLPPASGLTGSGQ